VVAGCDRRQRRRKKKMSVGVGGRRGVRRGGLRVGAVSPVNAGSHTARV
jgi:hypothetical protein